MSLQLICGSAGAGKSTWARRYVTENSRRYPDRNYIFMVPEQFTMRTQLDLVMEQETKGILNIDVLSFQRLAWRILEEAGQENARILTETGKSLILRRIAIDRKDELGILGRKLDRSGYVAEVKSALSEFAQYRIGADTLDQMIALCESKKALQYKLKDLRVLQEAFEEYLSGRLLTGEGLLEKLAVYAVRSDLLKKSTIVLDGFTGFTPIQMNVLRSLLGTCRDVLITLTVDVTAGGAASLTAPPQEHELFALSRKTLRGLYRIAAEEKVEILDPVIMENEGRRFHAGSALAHLEKNLFRPASEPFEGETDRITFHLCRDPSREARRAAVLIRQMVDQHSYRYEDIALVVGDMASYQNQIRRFFAMYHIPVFIDRKLDLAFNPCLEFIRGAMEMVQKHFSYESTFRFLRTGFIGIDQEKIDLAENYVLAMGISSGAAWRREWSALPQRMDEEDVRGCEETRKLIMDKLAPFLEGFDAPGGTVAGYAGALERLLESFEVKRQLEEEADVLKNAGAPERAQEYLQIYEIVSGLLSEITLLMGGETVKTADFMQILEAGFGEARVGIIPPSRHQVHVGDLERTRLEHVKVLLFLGMNDGWVPGAGNEGGIMSELDRMFLSGKGIELAPGERENSFIQRFYLYLCLTKPSGMLHIFRSTNTSDGKVLRPSYMITLLQNLFPGAKDLTEPEPGTDLSEIVSSETALAYLSGLLQAEEKSPEDLQAVSELVLWLGQNGNENEAKELARAALQRGGGENIPPEVASALYGDVLEGSVTRLESFGECAGRHFLDYGLRLKEREIREVSGADLGVVFHQALQLYSMQLEKSGLGWRETSRQQQEEILDGCVEQAIEQCRRGVFHDSARNEQISGRIKRIARRTVWALTEQIRAGDFEPACFERAFRMELNDGKAKVALSGRIDRVDIFEKDDKRYVKVIDYKSGAAGLDLNEFLYGLKLQLALYLDAAMEQEKKTHPESEVLPGALFYNHLSDPVVDVDSSSDDSAIDGIILKELRPDGLFAEESSVVLALDRMMDGTSLVIRAKKNNDGSLSASSACVPGESMKRLTRYVRKQILSAAEEIMGGKTKREPVRKNTATACDYCSWQGQCGFDLKTPGTAYRQIPALPKDRIWQEIYQKTKGGDR